MVNMTNQEYRKYVARRCPPSPLGRDMFRAFLSGGLICALGQGILALWSLAGLEEENAAGATSVTLIFLGVLLWDGGVKVRKVDAPVYKLRKVPGRGEFRRIPVAVAYVILYKKGFYFLYVRALREYLAGGVRIA